MKWFKGSKKSGKDLFKVTVSFGGKIKGKEFNLKKVEKTFNAQDASKSFLDRDVLDGYEIHNFEYPSLKHANDRKDKYEQILNRERTTGFAIQGNLGLQKMSKSDIEAVHQFDSLIKSELGLISKMPIEEVINKIADCFRGFNKNSIVKISHSYCRWYFEYATILFDINRQFDSK